MLYKLNFSLKRDRTKKMIIWGVTLLSIFIIAIGWNDILRFFQNYDAKNLSVSTNSLYSGPPQFLYQLYGGDQKFDEKEAYTHENKGTITNFKGPLAVTVSPEGEIFVADTGNSQIQSFSPSGQWLRNFGKDKMTSPSGLAYYDKKLYIADPNAKKIFVYSEEGKELPVLLDNKNLPLVNGKLGQVIRPSGIQVGPDHLLYITDIANHCVIVLDDQGNVLRSYGSPGVGDGQFQYPNALFVSKDGKIYVSDSNNGRIVILDKEGKFLTKITGSNGRSGKLALPRGIAVTDQGMIYVVDVFSQTVRVYDEAGIELWTFGGNGIQNGKFNFPNGIFIDSQAHIYVTDRENNRVEVFGKSNNEER